MNKTAIHFLIHFLVWVFVCFLGLIIVYNSIEFADTPSLIVTSLIFSIYLLINFYVFYYELVPDYLEKRKYKKFAICTILVVFLIIPSELLLWYGIFYYTDGMGFPGHWGQENISHLGVTTMNIVYIYTGSVLGSLFCGGLATSYRFGIDWFKNEQVKKDLENKNLFK